LQSNHPDKNKLQKKTLEKIWNFLYWYFIINIFVSVFGIKSKICILHETPWLNREMNSVSTCIDVSYTYMMLVGLCFCYTRRLHLYMITTSVEGTRVN